MRILDAALSAHWAIEEHALDLVLKIAAREHETTPEALEAYRAKALERAERATVRDGVAILNVEGPLFKKANLMVELSGATSYQILRRDLEVAIDDGNVRAILLNIDSPGGVVSGVAELANAIHAARQQKHVWAYAGDLAQSAAYWLGSQADHFVIGETAGVGSIGVVATFEDASALKEARGIRTHQFVSSVSPHKRPDPAEADGRERIQAQVDALADVFVDAVARGRDACRAFVLKHFGQGDTLIGQAAVKAGMADEIGSFESTIAALAANNGQPARRLAAPKAAPSGPTVKGDDAAVQAILSAGRLVREIEAGQASTSTDDAAVEAILSAGRLVVRGA